MSTSKKNGAAASGSDTELSYYLNAKEGGGDITSVIIVLVT